MRVAGKNPLLSEGLHLALLEVWSKSASLQREMLRGEAGQIGDGESELQGYIHIFRCGGEVVIMSAHNYNHHWHNGCLS